MGGAATGAVSTTTAVATAAAVVIGRTATAAVGRPAATAAAAHAAAPGAAATAGAGADPGTIGAKVFIRALVACSIAAAIVSGVLTAQEPSFEVASIKPNKSGSGMIGIRFPSVGQFNVINMPLREMIRFAYQVQLMQIEGGPDWANSDRFDIIAKAEGRPTMSQVNAMMRSLLAERFALKIHKETRDMPIYELVVARDDKRLGAQLQQATSECRPVRVPNGAPKPPPPPPGGPGPEAIPASDDGMDMRCGALFGPGFITLRQFTMDRFARDLTMVARRVVVNKTGLEGRWDIDVEFSPEFRPAPPPGAPEIAAPPSDGPSMFTAIQEQLGLKLESARGPVEMIVIDAAQRPEPD